MAAPRKGTEKAARARKSVNAEQKKAESSIAKGKPKDKDTHNMREFKNRSK